MSRIAQTRTLWRRIRSPISALGTGPKSWALTTFPGAISRAPQNWRVGFVHRHLPPEGAWWLRERVEGKAEISLNCDVTSAREVNGRVELQLANAGDSRSVVACDHVIVGSGFEADVDRLSFLSAPIRQSVKRIERAPKLGHHFEASVPGLYFVGPASALSFGPLFRFVAGASYAAPLVAGHLASEQASRARARPHSAPVQRPAPTPVQLS